MTLRRRTFLGGVLALAACGGSGDDEPAGDSTSTSGGTARPTSTTTGELPPDIAAVELPADPFTLGVASGDPDATSVVLWTRLAPDPLAPGGGMPAPGTVTAVAVEIATDDAFTDVVHRGRAEVDGQRGHSVHAVVDGLEPATGYAYRFRVGTHTSPVGRTRTAPATGDPAPVTLGVASCQRYGDGHYVAHRDMAAADLDVVVWLGDYVYEGDDELVRPLPPGAPAEAVDLEGYRVRYATARLDPDLAANHAAHPWVVTWDDHEVENNHTGAPGSVADERRAAAYQAWWEHMPVRLAPPDGATATVHRALRLGANLELLVLDTRQHRSAAGCDGGIIESSCDDLEAPDRTVLGPQQEAWFAEAAAASGARWAAVVQSVVLAPVEILGSVNADAWDGYPAARQRLLGAMAALRNPVVLTGDVHVQVVADVPSGDGRTVAAELVAPSVTSIPAAAYRDATGLLPTLAPAVQHAADARGWIRCDVDERSWRATFREVADVSDPASTVTDGAAFVIDDGVPGARRR